MQKDSQEEGARGCLPPPTLISKFVSPPMQRGSNLNWGEGEKTFGRKRNSSFWKSGTLLKLWPVLSSSVGASIFDSLRPKQPRNELQVSNENNFLTPDGDKWIERHIDSCCDINDDDNDAVESERIRTAIGSSGSRVTGAEHDTKRPEFDSRPGRSWHVIIDKPGLAVRRRGPLQQVSDEEVPRQKVFGGRRVGHLYSQQGKSCWTSERLSSCLINITSVIGWFLLPSNASAMLDGTTYSGKR